MLEAYGLKSKQNTLEHVYCPIASRYTGLHIKITNL